MDPENSAADSKDPERPSTELQPATKLPASSSGDYPTPPTSEDSLMGVLIITALSLIILVLLIISGFAWTESHDMKLRETIDERIQDLKSQEAAERRQIKAQLLQTRNEELKSLLERQERNQL